MAGGGGFGARRITTAKPMIETNIIRLCRNGSSTRLAETAAPCCGLLSVGLLKLARAIAAATIRTGSRSGSAARCHQGHPPRDAPARRHRTRHRPPQAGSPHAPQLSHWPRWRSHQRRARRCRLQLQPAPALVRGAFTRPLVDPLARPLGRPVSPNPVPQNFLHGRLDSVYCSRVPVSAVSRRSTATVDRLGKAAAHAPRAQFGVRCRIRLSNAGATR